MGKPSPTLLALAVAGVISVCGCAGSVVRSGDAPSRQVAPGGLEARFPNAADPNYEKTYAQYREQMADGGVVSPALGVTHEGDSVPIHEVGLGTGVSSVASSISSGVKNGFAKVGKALTPEERVVKAAEPTSVYNQARPTPDLYVAVARLHEQAGRMAEAEQQYHLALRMAPDHLGALLGYAHLKDRLGHWEEAIPLYQRAAGAHPQEPSVFNDLGLCYARNGRLDEAVAALNQAVQLQPKKPLYRNNIAIVLTEMGQTDAALVHLQAVQPEAVARYNLGQLLLRKGQREAAAQQFALALQRDPSLAQARAWLDELAWAGVTPGQAPAQIATRPAVVAPQRTAMRPAPAIQPPPAAPWQSPRRVTPAPVNAPIAQAPEPRPAKDLRSIYGNFPVPPARRLAAPPRIPTRTQTSPATAPQAPVDPAQPATVPQTPGRATWPPAARATTPRPQPMIVRNPAVAPRYAVPLQSVAPEPRAPAPGPALPAPSGPDPADAIAPLPPVTDTDAAVERVEPLPPVQPAPLPGR